MGFLDEIDLKQTIVLGLICFIGTQILFHWFGVPGFLNFGGWANGWQQSPSNSSNKPSEKLVYKSYTPSELYEYRGTNPQKPLLMGVMGTVFDVSGGARFYGPGGPYENFAGRDASRGLAKNSFEEDVLTPLDQPIDLLEDITDEEAGELRRWFEMFSGKYIEVGKLVNEPKFQNKADNAKHSVEATEKN